MRLTVARVILVVAAIAAAVAAVGAAPGALDAPADRAIVEWWRALGLGAFALVFAGLAARPRTTDWVWAAAILHKLGMTIVAGLALNANPGSEGAASALGWDGGLTMALIIARALVGRPRSQDPT